MFPENPEKLPSLWQRLLTQISSEPLCFLIKEGIGHCQASAAVLDAHDAAYLLERWQQADVCRVSASGERVVGRHFAAKRAGEVATITEFLARPTDGMSLSYEQLMRDLEAVKG